MPETEIWALISLASIYEIDKEGRGSKIRPRVKESNEETILYTMLSNKALTSSSESILIARPISER